MKTKTHAIKPNPFTPKSGQDPKLFLDRENEVKEFYRILKDLERKYHDHFVIIGPWGIGKTVLLKEFKRIAQKQNIPTALITAPQYSKKDREIDGVRNIVEQLSRQLPVEVGRLERFYDLMESIGVEVLGFGVNFTKDSKEISSTTLLEETLLRLWDDFKRTSEGLLILIDDVQNYREISTIFTLIKNVLSSEVIVKKTKILVGLTCTPGGWSEFQKLHHPIGRYFYRMNLKNFDEKSTLMFVDKLLEDTGVEFNDTIKKLIFDYAQGHLFELQLLCSNLYDNQINARVSEKVWESSLNQTLIQLGEKVFESFYDKASKMEKQLLYHLSKKDAPIEFTKFLDELKRYDGNVTKSVVSGQLTRLVDKGLISKPTRGEYLIPDKLLREYILKISKSDQYQ